VEELRMRQKQKTKEREEVLRETKEEGTWRFIKRNNQ
jgi:hypothetical protein